MSELYPTIAQCAVVATALKVLLFPAYKSTDFEVHRNWLALTHSLPVKEWYYEKTSEWTLDYPPFFAYFEWLLSHAAALVDSRLLNVKSLNYASWQTVYFQRSTVILSELVLVYALHLYVKTSKSKTTAHAVALSVLLSPGLLLIDHIHFQYNGFLFGFLVLSLVLARSNSTVLLSGLLFAVLLCFKHIYLYLAPAYFVYLLREYCLSSRSAFPYLSIKLLNCIKLGLGVASVFTVAFGPFVLWGQLEQVLRRLFPFSRGLCHAYWAPNVWALYSFADRVLIYLAPHLGLTVDSEAINSVTRGLVGDTSFAVLPDVPPLACFVLTLVAQIPFLLRLFIRPTWESFVGAVTLCGYASFLFGWHVHEKAILIVIIPFSLIALRDRRYLGAFRPLAVAGHVSLFPLLFTAAEFPVKTVYTIFWLVLFLMVFDRLAPASPHPRVWLLDRFSLIYITLSIPLIAYCSLIHRLIFGKPVKFEPLPPFLDDNTEVYVIKESGEVFTDYEKYLSRRDFYMQASPRAYRTFCAKNFTCESTGHQGYTFFEAVESEVSFALRTYRTLSLTSPQRETSKEIDSIFPEALRARVLQFVQFRNTPRMDDLGITDSSQHFREHFIIGDHVIVEHDGGRRSGVIDQIADSATLQSVFPGTSTEEQFRSLTYSVKLDGSDEKVTRYKAVELQRDRRSYSKLVLKQFLRCAVSREPWYGAPWIVKEHLAKRYNITTTVPEAKTRDAVIAAKKAVNASNSTSSALNGHSNNSPMGPINGPTTMVNGQGPQAPLRHTAFVNYSANAQPPPRPDQARGPVHAFPDPSRPQHLAHPFFSAGPAAMSYLPHPFPQHQQLPPHLAHIAQHLPPAGSGLPISLPFQHNFMQYQTLPPSAPLPQRPPPTLAKPFEPIKYPIEDLRIKQPRVDVQRPRLKFFSDDVPKGAEPPVKKTGILMKSMGSLLCIWETLNVHDSIYYLDSFTFDDFVDAIRFSSEEVDCELLNEVHCAVLSQIVNKSGNLQVSLPRIDESDDSEEASSESASPEPEPEPPVRTTRSSLRKSEANALSKQRTPTPEPPKQVHKAAEFLAEFNWIEACKTRNFRDGGWQSILVGLLHQLSFSPVKKAACDEVLAVLVPVDEDPSAENIAHNYIHMDVNLRIQALDMALQLTVFTEAFRESLVQASTDMTRMRKDKIDFQRKRKELADELFKLDNERKIQLPANMPPSPTDVKAAADVSMTATDDGKEDEEVAAQSGEEPVTGNRKLRHTKVNKRKRESEAAKKEKAKKAKMEAAKTKQQKEWEALLNAIEKKKEELKECEASINELDDDLREALVQRSKWMGKDRFLNKYYWFEHNGMPFGGVPGSSTADYGYANGRLWVQGPDQYELGPNMEEPALTEDQQEFGFTIPQRKEKEEGETHLNSSTEWGYYDDPEDLDKLIGWLDEKGIREKALRKELTLFRDRIAEYMVRMKEHLSNEQKAKNEDDEHATRVSTRNKTYVDKDSYKDRCLRWTNSIRRKMHGCSYMEQYKPPRKANRGTATKATKAKGRK
ncbi:uncharacterized protein EI97DRAFT_374129 [Westerdykella ornata]|uniref:Uncharacterized protein n=1 Tax=Westerdykella ornata TaxID=318751 RepID=A0A6A6JQ35_WESOR|nr:uncharacterized protein EI97DRAFT_374129 [Westerdykella ornata]KAF2277796.1 hypothetical protein EI97DRAFT_374129 [Westerdykella ornata]